MWAGDVLPTLARRPAGTPPATTARGGCRTGHIRRPRRIRRWVRAGGVVAARGGLEIPVQHLQLVLRGQIIATAAVGGERQPTAVCGSLILWPGGEHRPVAQPIPQRFVAFGPRRRSPSTLAGGVLNRLSGRRSAGIAGRPATGPAADDPDAGGVDDPGHVAAPCGVPGSRARWRR